MLNRKNFTAVVLACGLLMAPSFAFAKTKTKTMGKGSQTRRVLNDATRLASLLHDAQTTVSVNPAVWRTIGNEANTLANRVYANTSHNKTARMAARDVRTHVREFRQAALAGNASEARRHANMTMPFLNTLIDWAN